MKLEGMDGLFKNMSHYTEKTVQKVKAAAQMGQALVVNDAKLMHPYQDRTTNLTQSIGAGRVILTESRVEAEVVAGMEYASWVEFGTRRSRPYPFLVPALARNAGTFRRLVKAAI